MRFGVNVILDTLRGSKNEKVLRFGLDSNRYYATHARDTIVFLRQVLNYLVLTDYLENSGAVRSEAGKVMAAKLKGKAASEFMKMNRRYDKICAAKGHFS